MSARTCDTARAPLPIRSERVIRKARASETILKQRGCCIYETVYNWDPAATREIIYKVKTIFVYILKVLKYIKTKNKKFVFGKTEEIYLFFLFWLENLIYNKYLL